ncbi:MAG: tyrosine-type recombinase/integrase, partial [Halobacteriaceae archaeon]
VDWITSGDYDSGKLPQDLLTKEDVEAQIEAAYNYRDKAFIAVLWETGARIGELIDLTVGDIEDRGSKGLKVVIDGKTGSRRLPLRGSIPYVNRWLNDHPNPDDDAPLWCKIQQGSPDDQLGYRYIRDKILDKTMNAAEVDKPSNPHHYRHSRASYLANHFTEARLCEWFGWVQGSDVPAKYVHLSGRDLDDAYAELHGDTTSETRTETSVEECPRCGWVNEPDVRFCGECGTDMTLDPEELATPSVSIEDLNEAMKEFFSDPSSKGPVLDAMTEAVRENPEVVQAAVSEMFEGEPSVKKE